VTVVPVRFAVIVSHRICRPYRERSRPCPGLFVFGWAAAIATVGQDRRAAKGDLEGDGLQQPWRGRRSLIIGELAGLHVDHGSNSRDGVRASLTFGAPTSLPILHLRPLDPARSAVGRARRGWRFLCAHSSSSAIMLTISNGGFGLILATFLGAMFRLAKRRGMSGLPPCALAAGCGRGRQTDRHM